MRTLTLSLVLLCSAGCRDTGASSVGADALRFDTNPIVFEDTWVGTVRSVSLEVTNPARVSQSLTARTEAPFSVRASEFFLGGGSTEVITVTFRPTAAGPFVANLQLDDTALELRGTGLAIPECVAPTACDDARFDTGAGQCVTAPRADGAACEQQCLVDASCQAGACVGQPQDCGDGDACTIDACGSGGCTHAPVTCPAPSNPCKVPSCDPGAGCGEVDADDGVVCGADSCLESTVSVCISGACVQRTRPTTQRCTNTWAPVSLPGGGVGSGLAWDPVRSRMVRLVYGQTWLWDGDDWTQRFPAQAPPTGSWRWLSTDTHRNRVVTTLNGQTWEWDGSTWLFRADDLMTPDFPMGFAAMAYDSKRRRTVVFGGAGYGNAYLDTTWEWDGARWTKRTPAHRPSMRAGTMLAYDPVRERVVLFGGADADYNEFGDTWEFDGTDWTQRTVSGPTARYSGTLTWNPVRRTVMLLGGVNYDPLDQPWEFDGLEWKRLPALGTTIAYQGAAWDPVRQTVVVLNNGRTFAWDSQTLASINRPTPSPRTLVGVAFDDARNKVTLFGGYPSNPVNYASVDDTWQFSDGDWHELNVTPRPPPRYGMTFVYDPLRARTVMFGGTSEINTQGVLLGQQFSDLWDWDGTSWTQRTPTAIPPAGLTRAMTWDPLRQRVLMVAQNGTQWTLDGTTWVQDENANAWNITTIAFDEQAQRLMGVGSVATSAFIDGGWQPIGGPLPNNTYNSARITWVPDLQQVMAQVNTETYRWADGGWVNLQPGVKVATATQALVFDTTAQRLMTVTTSEQWVYLP